MINAKVLVLYLSLPTALSPKQKIHLWLALFSGYILNGPAEMVIIIIISVMTTYYIYSVPGSSVLY